MEIYIKERKNNMAYTQHFGLSRNSPLNMGGENTSKEIEPKTDTSPEEASSIISQNNSRKGPKHMLSQGTGDDSLWTKFKTAVANPFDAVKVMGGFDSNQFDGDGNTYDSMKDLRLAHRAKDQGANVPDLNRSSMFNTTSSLVGPAVMAQTYSDLASGDPKAYFAKKFNKLKPIKNVAKKLGPKLEKVINKGFLNNSGGGGIYDAYKTINAI